MVSANIDTVTGGIDMLPKIVMIIFGIEGT